MSQIYNEAAYNGAVKRYIVDNAKKTFEKNYPEVVKALNGLGCGDNKYINPFCRDMLRTYDTYGKLTERQIEAFLASLARQAERDLEFKAKLVERNADSQYLGNVGDKLELVLTCKAINFFDSAFGQIAIVIFETEDGQQVKYKGGALTPYKGDVLRVKASIKALDVYNGRKQTVIQRPKVLELIERSED
jgi:hypothetical protein